MSAEVVRVPTFSATQSRREEAVSTFGTTTFTINGSYDTLDRTDSEHWSTVRLPSFLDVHHASFSTSLPLPPSSPKWGPLGNNSACTVEVGSGRDTPLGIPVSVTTCVPRPTLTQQ